MEILLWLLDGQFISGIIVGGASVYILIDQKIIKK